MKRISKNDLTPPQRKEINQILCAVSGIHPAFRLSYLGTIGWVTEVVNNPINSQCIPVIGKTGWLWERYGKGIWLEIGEGRRFDNGIGLVKLKHQIIIQK